MPKTEPHPDHSDSWASNEEVMPLASVLAALDFLVLEKGEEDVMKVHGKVPGWAANHYGGDIESAVLESPFLSHFVTEIAAAYWHGPPAPLLSSGIWEEREESTGVAQHFEAMAINADRRPPLLVIKRLGKQYDQLQLLTQRANENALEHRQLSREMQKKDVLLKCIVHDLNNPLGAVLLNLELLAGSGDEEIRASATVALEAARRQRNLIKSIAEVFSSDLSRLGRDSGTSEILSDLVRATKHVVEMHLNGALRRSVSILLEDGTAQGMSANRRVRGEVDAFTRIVENLVLNALRYAPEDSTVTVTVSDFKEGLCVHVCDSGPGVEPQLIAGLFDPFTQGTTNHGSMGLGLYFCRMTIERWDGRIFYDPIPAGGARFVFTLPWVQDERQMIDGC